MRRRKNIKKMLIIFFILMLVKGTAPATGVDDSWRRVADLPTPRSDLAAAVVDGRLYVLGGSRDMNIVLEYDRVTDYWHHMTEMPTPRSRLAAAVVDRKIYALGGNGFNGIKEYWLATVEEYDPATDTWRRRAPMPTAREWLAAAVVDGKIYTIGGWGDPDGLLREVEEYDPVTDTWRRRAPMPTARDTLAAATLNGKIYVIGGWDGYNYLTTVEEYDPVTDTWRSRAPMPTPRSSLAAVAVGGRLYAIGGVSYIDHNLKFYKKVEEYDPATDSWTQRKGMPTGRSKLAAAVVCNKIYAIGGYDGNHLATVEEYDPPNHEDAPTITVEIHNGEESWRGKHTITWTATDLQCDPLTYTVYYSPNGGQNWTQLATGLTESSYLWDTTTVMNGANYLIRVEATDGTYIGVDTSNEPFAITNEATNTAPTARVLRPNGGEYWQETYPITWIAIDPQDDPLTYTVYYSPNGGQNWTQLATGLTESSYLWDTTTVMNGANYLIRVEATDGTYIGVDTSNEPFAITNEATNTAPTVRVLRPNGGERVHGMFEIQWSANDPEGDALTFTISYSPNGGDTWTQLTSGVMETSYQWDTSSVQVSENYLIKIEASDGRFITEDYSDYKFTIEREVSTETRSEALYMPSFRVVEALGALLVILGLGKKKRRREMFWEEQ